MDDTSDSENFGPDKNDTLATALLRHGIELPADQVVALDRYAKRLWDWNTRLNLTRHTTYEKFVGRDVVDSLRLAKLLEQRERVLDVGTGGGVPGAVIAILRPDAKVALCDSIAKKAKAVEAIVREAKLNAAVHHARAEDLLQRQRFDSLVVRAVAPLGKLLTWFKPHWPQLGRLLVVKGPSWVEERGEARHRGLFHGLELRKRDAYPLGGSESESVILEIKPIDGSDLLVVAREKEVSGAKKRPTGAAKQHDFQPKDRAKPASFGASKDRSKHGISRPKYGKSNKRGKL